MSCSLWRWHSECDSHICVGDCDLCGYTFEDEIDEEESDGTRQQL